LREGKIGVRKEKKGETIFGDKGEPKLDGLGECPCLGEGQAGKR